MQSSRACADVAGPALSRPVLTAAGVSTGRGEVRWRIRVTGVVQGVGFRPFVYTLAHELGLAGWVLNDPAGVLVEAQGSTVGLAALVRGLRDQAPPLAKVTDVRVDDELSAEPGDNVFAIRESDHAGRPDTIVPADSHVCEPCLAEVKDPSDRHYRYPFTNCTHCGPRYSLIQGLPYDRAQTTMSAFTMCAACQREYTDPLDRRYHAQPNACPECGPRLHLASPDATIADGDDALRRTTQALASGVIVAIKSIGGFHLGVNARDEQAVRRLRARKRRDSKPFAIMVADLPAVHSLAVCSDTEAELLTSPARPIVLLRKRPGLLPEPVAPRNPNLGIMLPSAPLHHLLLDQPGLDVLVMTSGNISGYPIAYKNDEALSQLFEVADLVLYNDRDIEVRIDDSVVRCSTHPKLDETLTTFLRRARGFAPYPVEVAEDLEPIVAYGAELKTTVALSEGRRVYVSQHIGDLKNDETYESHLRTGRHLANLHELRPRYVACDLHPAFRSTRSVLAEHGSSALLVQHHHAHMASCMAENQLTGRTLGVVFDGAGYGEDGTIWGGEFLLGDFREVSRVARLRPLSLVGGDRAVHEPIRTGLALALDAYAGLDSAVGAFPALNALSDHERHVFATMARKHINSPMTSSMGRLFDGVAALVEVCGYAEYEAHGPIELEGLLGRDLSLAEPYPTMTTFTDGLAEIDPRPIVQGIARDLAGGASASSISRRFHSTVVSVVVDRCTSARDRHDVDQVVLSGGVFLNEFLLVNCLVELRRLGFAAHCHRQVPTNDGGISLGQVMVANSRLRHGAATGRQVEETQWI